MVLVLWLCGLLLLSAEAQESSSLTTEDPVYTEESFVGHVREISDLLHTFINIVKTAAEEEGRTLNLPEVPMPSLPLHLESATLEELFDAFERACQSFRARFLKFMKAKLVETTDDAPAEEVTVLAFEDLTSSEDLTESGTEYEIIASESSEDRTEVPVSYEATASGSPEETDVTVEYDTTPSESPEENSIIVEYETTTSESTEETDVTAEYETTVSESPEETDTIVEYEHAVSESSEDETESPVEYEPTASEFPEEATETTVEEETSASESLGEMNSEYDISTPFSDDSMEYDTTASKSSDEGEVTVGYDPLSVETEDAGRLESTESPETTTGYTTSAHFSEDKDEAFEEFDTSGGVDESSVDVKDGVGEFDKTLHSRAGLFAASYNPPLGLSMVPIPGVRGEDFPDYRHIPETTFTCADKEYIPGFYADFAADCQVFHVCWPRRRESFLCPTGTTFNQRILSCDYWFNSTCPLSPDYYYMNMDLSERLAAEHSKMADDSIYAQLSDELYYKKRFYHTLSLTGKPMKFMPVHFRTTYYPARQLHPDTPEFEEFHASLPNHSDDSHFSSVEIEALARKIYEELYGSSIDLTAQTNKPSFRKMKTRKQKRNHEIFSESKSDRSGVVDPEVSPAPTETSVFEESTFTDDRNTVKPKVVKAKTNTGKDRIAPAVVLRVLETADNIVSKEILPLTREILAASYSKLHLHKMKKN